MEKKVVVITGASGGIGAATARLLGGQGHRIVLAARRENELTEMARQSGSDAVAVVADATRRDDVERLKESAIETCGRIDVWINNVGRGITRSVLELTEEDVDEMMSINLKSALYGMQAIVPYFKQEKRGHIINVSSFLGRVPLVTSRSVYSAAKAALNVLTANLRMDLREQYPNIHVSLVMPGMVLTDFHKNALGGDAQRRPAGGGNAQTAEEVGEAIASLIEHPQSEIYTNPASAEIARRYRENVDLFEEKLFKRE
jgi:NADP-dependent 3-hydroxy acid dehydrogenase YdfG